MGSEKGWAVEVVSFETGNVARTVECRGGERAAGKTEDGMLINLNHDRFYTRIVSPEDRK